MATDSTTRRRQTGKGITLTLVSVILLLLATLITQTAHAHITTHTSIVTVCKKALGKVYTATGSILVVDDAEVTLPSDTPLVGDQKATFDRAVIYDGIVVGGTYRITSNMAELWDHYATIHAISKASDPPAQCPTS